MTTIPASTVRATLKGYVSALLWANASCGVENCEGQETGECKHTLTAHDRFGVDSFTSTDLASIHEDVMAMITSNRDDFLAYVELRGAENFGHDFALTRNGHGAGFWDRGLGALGDRLTASAKPYGESGVLVSEHRVKLI